MNKSRVCLLTILLVGIALSLWAVPMSSAQSNLVTNGDFEGGFTLVPNVDPLDGSTPDNIPDGWTLYETFSADTLEMSTLNRGAAGDNGPSLPGASSLISTATGPNLITNGNFDGGNSGFSTAYHYVVTQVSSPPIPPAPGDVWLWDATTYTIHTDPALTHGYWGSFKDHTSGTGNMMIVNGNTNEISPYIPYPVSAPVKVWGQDITLSPVTTSNYYTFSFYARGIGADNPAQLQVKINNVVVGSTLVLSSVDSWQQFTITWNADLNSLAQIEIYDLDLHNAGSDFAMDDISFVNLTVDITKTASPLTRSEPGGVFTFTLNITNNSVENVTITALTDDNPLSAGCLALIGRVLTPGQSVSCTYDVTHTETGTYNNTAAVTVTDNEGNTASHSDDETVTVTNVNPTVDITKTASPLTRSEPGGVFTFTLNITNNSVENVTITALTDDNPLSAGCLALVGRVLTPGQSVSCTYDVTHTETGTYNNTASVTVRDNEGNTASHSDDETVTNEPAQPSPPAPAQGVPALSQWGMVVMAALFALVLVWLMTKRLGSKGAG